MKIDKAYLVKLKVNIKAAQEYHSFHRAQTIVSMNNPILGFGIVVIKYLSTIYACFYLCKYKSCR